MLDTIKVHSMARKPRRQEHFRCPYCEAPVPVGAKQCPECYSDDETGWSETAYAAELDLPTGYGGEEDFDYAEYAEQEHDQPRPFAAKPGIKKYWPYLAALIVLLSIGLVISQVQLPPETEPDHDELVRQVKAKVDKLAAEQGK